MIGEQALWLAVIEQAFFSAQRQTHRVNIHGQFRETRHAKHVVKDRKWLTDNSAGFRNICALAGLDPEWVRDKFREKSSGNLKKRDKARYGT